MVGKCVSQRTLFQLDTLQSAAIPMDKVPRGILHIAERLFFLQDGEATTA